MANKTKGSIRGCCQLQVVLSEKADCNLSVIRGKDIMAIEPVIQQMYLQNPRIVPGRKIYFPREFKTNFFYCIEKHADSVISSLVLHPTLGRYCAFTELLFCICAFAVGKIIAKLNEDVATK
jgi:hypothetical protein